MPEHILRRMEKADAAGNAQEEGIQVALELIEKLRQYKEVNGLHLMTVGWEEIIPRLVHDAGLSQS